MVLLKNSTENKGIFNFRSLFYMANKNRKIKVKHTSVTIANNSVIPTYTLALY